MNGVVGFCNWLYLYLFGNKFKNLVISFVSFVISFVKKYLLGFKNLSYLCLFDNTFMNLVLCLLVVL